MKVSTWACKCVFYGQENRVQLKEQIRNGVIGLVIMFITRVIVVPVSKVAHFSVFFPDDRKRIWAHFGQNI